MKKITALTLSMLMVLSILPVAVFATADMDVQSVYDALTEEMLTTDNEPEGSVTKNLNFNLSEDITLPEGVAVSFSSGNTSVISNDGTVIRDLEQKNEVTISASITKAGAQTLTKELKYTVLPQKATVLANENFYYPTLKNSDLVTYTGNTASYAIPNWSLSNQTSAIVANDISTKLLLASDGTYNVTTVRTNTDSYADLTYLQYSNSSIPNIIQGEKDKFVTLSLNINPVSWGNISTKQLYIIINGQDASGTKTVTYFKFYPTQTIISDSKGSASLYTSSTVKLSDATNNQIDIKIDYNKKLAYLYINEEPVNPDGTAITDATYVRQFASIQMGYYRECTEATLQLNDFSMYKETDYVVSSASSLTSELLADGQSPSFITEDLRLPGNTDITFTSNNTDVISNTGKVTRPVYEDATVTLTATDATTTKELTFVVKSRLVSGIAYNNSFNSPYFAPSSLNTTPPFFSAGNSYASARYATDNYSYFLDYTSATSYDASAVKFSQDTGSTFPVGSSGKYIFEFDMCCNNANFVLFSFQGNGKDAVRFDNCAGNVYVSNTSNEWYGPDSSVDGTIPKDTWVPVKMVIDTVNNKFELTINNERDTSELTDLIEGSSFTESIGFRLKTRDATETNKTTAKIDNLRLYTESSPDDVLADMPNADKAGYFSDKLTQSSLTNEKAFAITQPLTLNSAFADYNLEELGVNVSWTSSNPSVISNTGTVTRGESSEYVVMMATITAGSGDDSATATKSFPFTVAAANSSLFKNYSYDFEDATSGIAHSDWNGVSNATAVVADAPLRDGKALKIVTSSSANYARTKDVTGGTLENVYFVSADAYFAPDSPSECVIELFGASLITRIGLNFKNNSVSFNSQYFAVPEVEVKTGEWYHFDIEFNTAKKSFTGYINGHKIMEEPVDVSNSNWIAWYPVRKIGLYTYAPGTYYLDNVTIRESDYKAPVYDENSDYTVRSIFLTNQDGKTITNIVPTTTEVLANVKIIENRTPVDGETKIFFARYSKEGKLEDIVSTPITTSNKGAIITSKLTITGDCSDDSLKVFVLNSKSFAPISKNLNSSAPKFDAQALMAKQVNYDDALELGYNAESKYDGIDAIIYDGDTYNGRKARHFAYIGLPDGASENNPVPAVVCVHGGGGTAYDEWVKKWNEKGYAAIAMNLNGRIPSKTITDGNSQLRHAWPGATQDNYGTVSPDDGAWMYSAVTAVISAHNILRSMPKIDNTKIGITGVSWGGVVTSTTLGVDNRFAFAIPSYGCGFLCGSETYFGDILTEDEKLWDPSNFIAKSNLPILWMNGDQDGNFSLTSTSKSAILAGNKSYPCIIPGFGHDHSTTWNRQECYNFADSIVKNGAEFIRGDVTVSGSVATVKTNRAAQSAVMYYTTSETLSYGNNGTKPLFTFSTVSSSSSNTDTFTFDIPSDAKKFYISFTDSNGNKSSTVLIDIE